MRKIEGPIVAEVVRVVDGDTVEVKAFPWPQQSMDVLVRLRGVDAPELHAPCASERDRAARAKGRLTAFLAGQAKVLLTHISGDKYFGRIVADLGRADGGDAASMLIVEDLARPYDGGKKPPVDCRDTE